MIRRLLQGALRTGLLLSVASWAAAAAPATGLATSAALRATILGPAPAEMAPMPENVPLQEIIFALGVTTGITLEFQFGTNWAYYSHYVGDVFGARFL